jgi:hypothetical protein
VMADVMEESWDEWEDSKMLQGRPCEDLKGPNHRFAPGPSRHYAD